MRRNLTFDHLDQAVAECKRLLEAGYEKKGNWTLGQMCRHIRISIEANMNGYPTWMTIAGYPLRPILRWFVLPRLLDGKSPSGVKTAGMFVPPENLNDKEEVAALASCVVSFLESDTPLHGHPGFGLMSREKFNKFHAAHTAHHLSFLSPAETNS